MEKKIISEFDLYQVTCRELIAYLKMSLIIKDLKYL